ncbi:hypothetical protein TeGR_g10045, partial [Tetraparma gracilis]
MRADHYDKSADVYSYGVCLVAMIRAESTIQTFFYECLRKFRRKKNLRGLGMGQMTKFLYDKAWRPLLPTDFVKCYPKLHKLIQESWQDNAQARPTFDQIVERLETEIADEVRRKDEPFITMMSVEEDSIYHTRLEAGADSLEEAAMDSDEEQELETKREGGVTKRQYQAVLDEVRDLRQEKAMREKQAQEMEQELLTMRKQIQTTNRKSSVVLREEKREKEKVDGELKNMLALMG